MNYQIKDYLKAKSLWIVSLILILTAVLFSCTLGLARPAPENEHLEANSPVLTTEPNGVASLIQEGKFEQAARRLNRVRPFDPNSKDAQLTQLVEGYNAIEKRREERQYDAYQEKLTELQTFQDPCDPNYVGDFNDVNDITSVLSVVARAKEYANAQQRDQLLSDGFVQKTIDIARAQAAEFESQGKWLKAYTNCYSWLESIFKDNEKYKDHAEQLLEKANIVGSFQDSPCETRVERYKGVNPRIFRKSVEALNYNYVKVIDYAELAEEAIQRCQLLGEVMQVSYDEIVNANGSEPNSVSDFNRPGQTRLNAWRNQLNAISADVADRTMGLTKDEFLEVFKDVLELNKKTVNVPEKVVIAQFAEASFKALDPYTTLIWPKRVESFEKAMTNEFTGIGIEISKEKGRLTVASLLPGTPAYRSGLDAGDTIVKVDDISTKDMSLNCAVQNITGPAGTNVKLTLSRPGEDKTREITITRAKITVPTIRGWKRTLQGDWEYMVDTENKIGMVRITNFSEKTAQDFEKVLNKLEAREMQGLILDLRFNPGGLLDSAADIVDKFISEGLIVSTRPRFGVLNYLSAHKKGTHPDYPLVILVNSYSASASEIVAGALADPKYNRAILVGERTHGKGSVQGITSYPGGGAKLKYTMAYYHLPSGQRVKSKEEMKKKDRQDWGVAPDVKVELKTFETRDMTEVRRENDVLVRKDHGTEDDLEKHSLQETLKSDPQLAVGLIVLKSELINRGQIESVN